MLGVDQAWGMTVGMMVGMEKMMGVEEMRELRGRESFI